MGTPYVGEIRMFGCGYEVAGWTFCDGKLLPISENDVLFTVIGTMYGGDGQETFAVPDLRGRLPVHQGNGFTPGEAAGAEEVTLTTQTIPVHTHTFLATTKLADQPTPGGNVPAQSGTVQLWTEDNPTTAMAPQAITATGGSQPHENMHPYLVINFQISLFGEFPSQT
jgi:microcystin-dependent protein